jgi:hypothetical protein
MNIENEPAERGVQIQRSHVNTDKELPERDISFRNLYQCAWCETCWSAEDATPGELSDCPGCEKEAAPYTWSRWIHRHVSN